MLGMGATTTADADEEDVHSPRNDPAAEADAANAKEIALHVKASAPTATTKMQAGDIATQTKVHRRSLWDARGLSALPNRT